MIMGNKRIFIFYHLYMYSGKRWQTLFKYHLNEIIQSGLYDECHSMHLGLIHNKERNMQELHEIIAPYSKIKVLYKRDRNTRPIVVWDKPKTIVNRQLGEGETILKMAHAAKRTRKKKHSNDLYLFFHTKSVSHKPNKFGDKRRMVGRGWFKKEGLNINTKNGKQFSRQVKEIMCRKVVGEWRERVQELETKSVYYAAWNFFWIHGDLLKKFNFSTFSKEAQFPKKFGKNNRHFTAIFPINLYGLIHNKTYPRIMRLYGFSK